MKILPFNNDVFCQPWPSWHGHQTVPITDFEGIAAPWNVPTVGALAVGETKEYAIRLTMAEAGPRTRNAALTKAGKAVLQAVPGCVLYACLLCIYMPAIDRSLSDCRYVIAPDMATAKLHVTPPAGVTLKR